MPPAIDWSRHRFHPVVHLPTGYDVYDLTGEYDENRNKNSEFGVGRYNEKRPNTYTSELFESARHIHMGLDLRAPVGTPVHAFYDGEIFLHGYNGADGDYGYTLITRHVIDGVPVFAMHGHLAGASIEPWRSGDRVAGGQAIAAIGDRHENGNWPHHLHFQLSFVEPKECDMPGVVTEADHEEALLTYPDPRLVLGPLYLD